MQLRYGPRVTGGLRGGERKVNEDQRSLAALQGSPLLLRGWRPGRL